MPEFNQTHTYQNLSKISKRDQSDSTCTILAQPVPIRSNLDQSGPIWTKLHQLGKLGQTSPNLAKLGRTGIKKYPTCTNLALSEQISPELFNLAKHGTTKPSIPT